MNDLVASTPNLSSQHFYVSFGYGSHDKECVSSTLVFPKAKLLPADYIVNHFFHSEQKYVDKNFSYVVQKADQMVIRVAKQVSFLMNCYEELL